MPCASTLKQFNLKLFQKAQPSNTCIWSTSGSFRFPSRLSPLAEQHRIVAKVNALMALCDRMEVALTTTDATRARLLEAVLHEALQPEAELVEAAE